MVRWFYRSSTPNPKNYRMAYGEITGVHVGQHFDSRQALCAAGVHRMTQNGIAGYGGNQPAESIVLSGGYQDDIDDGDEILYTGEGGQEQSSGRQVKDQTATRAFTLAGVTHSHTMQEPLPDRPIAVSALTHPAHARN